MVGEDIRGVHGFAAALHPPAPEAKEQDKDGEREEEEDVCNGEGCEDGGTRSGIKAAVEEGNFGGVGIGGGGGGGTGGIFHWLITWNESKEQKGE